MQFQLMALDDNANCQLNTDKCAAETERKRERGKECCQWQIIMMEFERM